MHCASLGEFEQGRPLLEQIKQLYPGYRLVLTFFSPSGYEIRKNYPGVDLVTYLPMDSAENAKRFISELEPELVLWVKYEYWYYYLTTLQKKNIPVLLISGIFRESQPFFKWYGSLHKNMLSSFYHLFVQDERSYQLVKPLHPGVSVNGDTRFDRVIAIAGQAPELPAITRFCGKSKVVVAGSTWLADEIELIHYVRMHPEIKFIIAPHEIDPENLAEIRKEFKKSIYYSQLEAVDDIWVHTNVLIIDNIGMLSRLYQYATIAYVGGGFGNSGIHNILEAAVYGKPVIFGPVFYKFKEARDLVSLGGAFPVNNAIELENLFDELLGNNDKLMKSEDASRDYVLENQGATRRIMDYIAEKRLLIS